MSARTTPQQRVAAYIARRKKDKGNDVEHIHVFDFGPEGGIELLLSDLEALVAGYQPPISALNVPENT